VGGDMCDKGEPDISKKQIC